MNYILLRETYSVFTFKVHFRLSWRNVWDKEQLKFWNFYVISVGWGLMCMDMYIWLDMYVYRPNFPVLLPTVYQVVWTTLALRGSFLSFRFIDSFMLFLLRIQLVFSSCVENIPWLFLMKVCPTLLSSPHLGCRLWLELSQENTRENVTDFWNSWVNKEKYIFILLLVENICDS